MDHRRARDLLELVRAASANRGRTDDRATARLRSRTGEIDEAVDVLLAGDRTAALELVSNLGGFWQDTGLVDEGRVIASRVLQGMDGLGGAHLANALSTAAELAFRQGDQGDATALARRAIDAATDAADTVAAATAWLVLARVAFRDGDAAAIEAASMTALELAGEDELTRRGALHMLAWAAHTAGNGPEARRRFEASLAYRRSVEAGPLSEAVELANIADLDLDAGALSPAARGLGSIVETARALDNRYLLVNAIPSVAALAAAAGHDLDAGVLFGALDRLGAGAGLTPDPGGERADERAAVSDRLGTEALDAALAEGRSLSIGAAIDRALSICNAVASPAPPGEPASIP